jgi:hypothetical protein
MLDGKCHELHTPREHLLDLLVISISYITYTRIMLIYSIVCFLKLSKVA